MQRQPMGLLPSRGRDGGVSAIARLPLRHRLSSPFYGEDDSAQCSSEEDARESGVPAPLHGPSPALHASSLRSSGPVHESYSDDDIELVHEIVLLGESLYPTLPERERLPTNALFLAAEEVLPRHGYDPENAPSHLSRLIFKIGGQRSGDTLSDKFKAVLEGIGIRLEFVPSSSPPQDLSAGSLPRPSSGLGFGSPIRVRARLPSISPSRSPSEPQSRPASEPPSVPLLSESSPHQPRGGSAHQTHNISASSSPSVSIAEPFEYPSGPGLSRPSHHPPWASVAAPPQHPTLRGSPSHPQYPEAQRIPSHKYQSQPPTQPPTQSPSASSDRSAKFGREYEAPVAHVPALRPVVDLDEALLEVYEGKVALVRMEEDRNLVSDVFGAWHATACDQRHRNDALKSAAAEYDNNDLLGEVLDIWLEQVEAAEQQRLKAEAAAKHEAYVARMERRATRVYEIFTIRNVLAQWQDQAQEEVDRTAVARRHLVRRRTFEGWRAQHIEDETKVQNFILGHALQRWSQVALHHEIRREVAVQWHQQQLCKQSLGSMWEEVKERLADEFYAVGLARDCLDAWRAKAHGLQDEYQVAVALDERLLLDEAVNIWLEEVEEQQYNAYECTRQFLVLGCRRDLDYWQEQARLSALLRQFTSEHEQKTQRQVVDLWYRAFQDAKRSTAVADRLLLQEPFDHWEREMKLKLFVERDEYETKAAVLTRWSLEEKLVWYRRHLETRTKQLTLSAMMAAARQARRERVRHEEEADYISSYHTQAEVLDTWLDETDQMWKHHQNASLVNLYRTTRPCIDLWREQCNQSQARDSFYHRKADRHRARSLVSGVLDNWPAIAETARRTRMMNSLRQFRRQYKVELAQDCLDKWLNATAEAVDMGRDAYQANLHYRREDLGDCLDFWTHTAQRSQNIRQIAADAELEVYCGRWQAQLQEAQENMEDAIEYDAEQTRKRCWEKWEFQALQLGSKRHMAATLQEKNERRLQRHVLDEWQQKAVPESAAARFNPRTSTLSFRRSARQQLARSSTASYYTASQLATLHPPEFDEDSLLLSTPARWTGYRPTTTPSAILPTPRERELRRQFDIINEDSGEL